MGLPAQLLDIGIVGRIFFAIGACQPILKISSIDLAHLGSGLAMGPAGNQIADGLVPIEVLFAGQLLKIDLSHLSTPRNIHKKKLHAHEHEDTHVLSSSKLHRSKYDAREYKECM